MNSERYNQGQIGKTIDKTNGARREEDWKFPGSTW